MHLKSLYGRTKLPENWQDCKKNSFPNGHFYFHYSFTPLLYYSFPFGHLQMGHFCFNFSTVMYDLSFIFLFRFCFWLNCNFVSQTDLREPNSLNYVCLIYRAATKFSVKSYPLLKTQRLIAWAKNNFRGLVLNVARNGERKKLVKNCFTPTS